MFICSIYLQYLFVAVLKIYYQRRSLHDRKILICHLKDK